MRPPSVMAITSGNHSYRYFRLVIREDDPLAVWMLNEAQDMGTGLNDYLKIVLRDRQQRQAKQAAKINQFF